MSAVYVPGEGVALVASGCALVFARPDDALIERCWPLVQRGASVGEFVAALTRDGFSGLGDFALLRAGSDGRPAVALVRGRARILPSSGGVDGAVVAGGSATTWVETELSADRARLTLTAEASGTGWPIVEGVVRADSVDFPLGTGPSMARTAAPETPPVNADVAAPVAVPVVPAAGALINATPWSIPAAGAPAPTASDSNPPPPQLVEPDQGATARTDPGIPPGSPPPASMEPGAAWSGPPVHAVVCPYGHLSAPYATSCRVCGTPVAAQEPILTARPLMGVLRLSTGDVIPLDRGVVLGRNPRPGSEDDPARPHVVALPSPNKDISRSHVEVRLEDWTVLVTDLGSTNGTTVAIPGHPPVRLRPHEPTPIEVNTEVNLADEVVFRFEVTQ